MRHNPATPELRPDQGDPPPPLTPPTLDVRKLPWFKLNVADFIAGDFAARTVDDGAWRAGVVLMAQSWHSVPAGSLPDDDVALARLAGFGRDLSGWRKVREAALAEFVLCSDGRLYHPALCRQAVEADAEFQRIEARRRRDRARKAGGIPTEGADVSSGDHAEFHDASDGIPAKNALRRDETRQEPPQTPRRGAGRVFGFGDRRPAKPTIPGGDQAALWRNRLSAGPRRAMAPRLGSYARPARL